MTNVLNLSTGEEQQFDLPPERAVVAAYEQSRGNWSTWTYERTTPRFGRRSVSCGDFTALTPLRTP